MPATGRRSTASYDHPPSRGSAIIDRHALLAVLATGLVACGGQTGTGSTSQPSGSPAGFGVVDEQMALTTEQRAALAEAGFHTEGLLQGVPTTCRIVEGTDEDLPVGQIVTAMDSGASRGPLVAVDAGEDTTLIGVTLVTSDGAVGSAAVWTVDLPERTITAANELAADLTGHHLVPVDTAGETAVASAMAEVTDCSWVAADVTHVDPPAPEPQMRPDLLRPDPPRAVPGQLVALHFPEQTSRGIAFQLDRRTGGSWTTVAWMTSDGNGDDPVTVTALADGYGYPDVGVGGPGPDHVRLPQDLLAGRHRICTANAGEEFCAALDIAAR